MPTLITIAAVWLTTTAVLLVLWFLEYVVGDVIIPRLRSKDARYRPERVVRPGGGRHALRGVREADLVARRYLVAERWIRGHHYIYRCEPADVGRLSWVISRDALDPKHPLTPHAAGVLQEQLYYQEVDCDE